MVPDWRLPGGGDNLVSGGGILQLVEQGGGVAGRAMVLCDCEMQWGHGPGIQGGDEADGELSETQGYRLPTEAEMEYATRAGAVTSRYYGETEELLPKYAWYKKNAQDRTWPVGSLKPNDLGLFDVQGNVFTWCQESFQAYPNAKEKRLYEDKEDKLSISLDNRVLRGGSFAVQASVVRSAFRNGIVPTYRSDGDVGCVRRGL